MKSRSPKQQGAELRGLDFAPAQVRGAVRIVPLLRREIRGDLRLAQRSYNDDLAVVSLAGELMAKGIKYVSYVPHGLVMSWSDDGSAVAAFGAELTQRDGKHLSREAPRVRVLHRMVRREEPNRLRLLPLHLAMEGFLSLHFGGPDIAWSEYSARAISLGLDPRSESSVRGAFIPGLDDALRVFEIHERQVGVLLFVANALASVFVVSNPEDYRALHRTLLEDFYGPLLFEYGLRATETRLEAGIETERVSSLDDLRRELSKLRNDWGAFHATMADGLFGKAIATENVYRAGPFQLQRFSTDLELSSENHIGELIVREGGELEYMKTFRLSAAQTRRAFLLSQLAQHNFNIEATAASLKQSKDEFLLRMEKAGFGYLLKEPVLQAARRKRRG